jgi:alkylated DNA repair dioxygenase AlkB
MTTPLPDFKVLTIAPGYDLHYLASFLPPNEATKWFERLLAGTPWTAEVVTMLGKQHVLRRQTAQFGRDYDYNPTAQAAREWTPLMLDVKALVEQATHTTFDSALCNLYPDGAAGIGWHSDAGHPELIASLSLGAVRVFKFAPIGSNSAVFSMEPGHGSLLLIPRKVNDAFKHSIAESKRCREPRINVTFRKFLAC